MTYMLLSIAQIVMVDIILIVHLEDFGGL